MRWRRFSRNISAKKIYRIGYEAIRNACAHSRAGRIEMTLRYTHDLTLSVSDNGAGIDPSIVGEGREGHFGLRGMKDRAERIGSKYNLRSSPDSGTLITLVVPGNVAFRAAGQSWSRRIRSLFRRS